MVQQERNCLDWCGGTNRGYDSSDMQVWRGRFRQGLIAALALVLASRLILEESPIADWLVSPLLVSNEDNAADIIVVAGAGVVGPCEPNLSAVRRVLTAVSLWEASRAPMLMFTGGVPDDLDCAVSDVMADLAARLGVPRDRILTEATSTSTRENALYANPALRSLGVRRLLLVTDQLHMLRASRAFETLGYVVGRVSVPVYATNHGNIDMLNSAGREFAAIAYYWSRGWLTPSAQNASLPTGESVTTPHSASDYRALASSAPIVVLGASYAQGWILSPVAGSTVINAGVAGETTTEMAARFERDVLARAPRAVVIWGFINDVFRAPRAEVPAMLAKTRTNLTDMIARGQSAGVRVILATEVTLTERAGLVNWAMALTGRLLRRASYQDYVNALVEDTNRWIRQTAQENAIVLLDLAPVVSDASGRRLRRFAQGDGSHLTSDAYAALTRYSLPILERHLRAARARPADDTYPPEDHLHALAR